MRTSPKVIRRTRVKLCIGHNESEPEQKALLRESGHTAGNDRFWDNRKGGEGLMQEWRALVEGVQRLWPGSRRVSRAQRPRLAWQTCRRCHCESYLRLGGDGLCSSCRSLQ